MNNSEALAESGTIFWEAMVAGRHVNDWTARSWVPTAHCQLMEACRRIPHIFFVKTLALLTLGNL